MRKQSKMLKIFSLITLEHKNSTFKQITGFAVVLLN